MKRHALFIGVDKYSNGIQQLNCARKDAEELWSLFKHRIRFDHVEKLVDEQAASADAVRRKIRQMVSGLTGGDLFLLYFSGHGVPYLHRQLLVLSEAAHREVCSESSKDPPFGTVALDSLIDDTEGDFDRAFLLDMCRAPLQAGQKGFPSGLSAKDLSLGPSCPDRRKRQSWTVVYSCDEKQRSVEIPRNKRGLFSLALSSLVERELEAGGRMLLDTKFVGAMENEMAHIALGNGIDPEAQKPQLEPHGNPIILVDPSWSRLTTTDAPVLLVCPDCGKKNEPKDTFKCLGCGRDNLCLQHQDPKMKWCKTCARREKGEKLFRKGEDAFFGQNYTKAVEWYLKAAENGHAGAQFALGLMYAKGQGVSQDDKEAVGWYRKAAGRGHTGAQCNIAWMYENGRGVAQNDKLAVAWYRRAAARGYADAQFALGLMYANGRGVPQSYKDALEWYWNASEKGHAAAQWNLMRLVDGEWLGDSEVDFWNRQTERGDVFAQFAIGLSRFSQSEEDAKAYFRKAAERGDAFAQFSLGMMLLHRPWYRKVSQFFLSLIHSHRRGVSQGNKEALEWLRKSAEQGNTFAQLLLATSYLIGRGVPQSDLEALAWVQKAANQGNYLAQRSLGAMYEDGQVVPQSIKEAMGWYRKAAEQSQVGAQGNLGWMHEKGREALQHDKEVDARQLADGWQEAAERGDASACFKLGLMSVIGRGVPQSDKEAVAYFRQAAEKGHVLAEFALGLMYANGRGVLQNCQEAVIWFKKAAGKGEAGAQCNLAWMYENGWGVPQSYAKAMYWYQKAAAKGEDMPMTWHPHRDKEETGKQ